MDMYEYHPSPNPYPMSTVLRDATLPSLSVFVHLFNTNTTAVLHAILHRLFLYYKYIPPFAALAMRVFIYS